MGTETTPALALRRRRCATADNCLGVANPDQHDSDGDGLGNACEPAGSQVSAPGSNVIVGTSGDDPLVGTAAADCMSSPSTSPPIRSPDRLDDMPVDFTAVSDHCPVVLGGGR